MCPVILWLLLGSVFKCCLKHQKKKCSHRERCARAKAKVKKFWRRASSVALVVRCRRRPSNKPPPRMHQESTSSEPVRWKWKKRKVGLDSAISRLESSTFDRFVRLVTTFYACPNYWILFAITIITLRRSNRHWIEWLYFVVLMRCISQSPTISIPRR